MQNKKVISRKNLPAGFPVTKTVVLLLILDYVDAKTFVWILGVAFLVILWLVVLVVKAYEQESEIFYDGSFKPGSYQSDEIKSKP